MLVGYKINLLQMCNTALILSLLITVNSFICLLPQQWQSTFRGGQLDEIWEYILEGNLGNSHVCIHQAKHTLVTQLTA
jgi:hypothetical protein